MSGRPGRGQRVKRLHEIAEREKDRALADLQATVRRVDAIDRQRLDALQNTSAFGSVSLGLRGYLAGVGSRHLLGLADQKADISTELETKRVALESASSKVRSLERLLERIALAEASERRRREAADLQDLVSTVAAKGQVTR